MDENLVASIERADKWIRRLSLLLSIVAVLAVLVLSVVVVNMSTRVVDLANGAKAASKTNTRLLLAQQPCDPKKDPNSPACERRAESNKVVAEAITRINQGTKDAIDAATPSRPQSPAEQGRHSPCAGRT